MASDVSFTVTKTMAVLFNGNRYELIGHCTGTWKKGIAIS